MKALLLICSIVFLSSTAFAKSKVKDSGSFKFDYTLYKKMTKKERSQYLWAYKELLVQLEKDKSKNMKSAFFDLQQLLIPYADAAKYTCYNGGLAYSIEGDSEKSCDSNGPAGGESAFMESSCSGSTKRCSIALGLSDDYKVGCWTKASKATSSCESQAGGEAGMKRLEDQLNQCISKTTTDKGMDCGKLTAQVTADTAELDAYCENGRWKSTCNRVKSKVAKVRELAKGRTVDPNAPSLDVASDASGCGPAEHKVLEDAYKKQTGKGIDPKWSTLVGMTEKACRMNNFDLLKQMGKFGACADNGSSSLSDIQNSVYGDSRPNLKSAVEKLKNGGSFNNEEIGQFKDFFGMSPTEYTSLFCKSGSSKDFMIAIEGLGGISSQNAASGMVAYILDGSEKVQGAVDRMPSGGTRDKLKSYYSEKTKIDGLRALVDNAGKDCKAGVALQCSNKTRYSSDLNAAQLELNKKVNVLKTDLAGVQGNFSNDVRAQKEIEKLKGVFGSGWGTLDQAYQEHAREKSAKSGEMTAEGRKQRDRLVQCAKESMTQGTKNAGKANEEKTYTSNFSGCNKTRLNNLDAGQMSSMYGSYYLKAKDGSRSCYVATERPFAKDSCSTKTAIKVSTGSAVAAGSNVDRPELCLEDVLNKFTAYEIACNASANRSDEGSSCSLAGGGSGTIKYNSSGDRYCAGGTVGQ